MGALAVTSPSLIAVVTEDSEHIGIVIVPNPAKRWLSPAADLCPVSVSAALAMVQGQKLESVLPTALALTAVVGDDFFSLPAVLCALLLRAIARHYSSITT